MDTIYKVAAILVFPKYAVYFKLNFLSSYICKPICGLHLFSLIWQSIILFCLKICHSGLENTRFGTKSQGGSHMLHSQKWLYTNMTNYEFPCKILMQLSRNSYTNQAQTYQISFFIIKMALYLILELSVVKYFEAV